MDDKDKQIEQLTLETEELKKDSKIIENLTKNYALKDLIKIKDKLQTQLSHLKQNSTKDKIIGILDVEIRKQLKMGLKEGKYINLTELAKVLHNSIHKEGTDED